MLLKAVLLQGPPSTTRRRPKPEEMGNRQNKEATPASVVGSAASKDDAQFSDDPLFVLYGAPDDEGSRRAVELLERKQLHHCKIGVDHINEALAGVPDFLHRHPRVPQIFSCPSAEMLQDEAGSAPGALGATAHGAVKGRMCRYIGGYWQLEKHTASLGGGGDDEPTETIYKTIDLPSLPPKGGGST